MSNNLIKVTGLTPPDKIPQFLQSMPHNEIHEVNKISLSENRPKIKKIINFDIKMQVKSYKKVSTTSGDKLVISASKELIMVYYSMNNMPHKVKFCIPCNITIALNKCNNKIEKVLAAVKKLSIKIINSKSFYLYSTVFAAAVIKHKKPLNVTNSKIKKQKKYTQNKTVKSNNSCNSYNNYNVCLNSYFCLILVLVVLNKLYAFRF